MKNMKKLLAFVLVAVMALGLIVSANAAPTVTKTALVTGDNAGTASITVTLPTYPDGSTANDTYKVYKLFDATTDASGTGISYKLPSGVDAAPAGFTVDDAGNVYLGTVSDTKTNADGEIALQISGATKYLTPQTTELTAAQIAAIQAYITDNMLAATVTTAATDTSFTVDKLPFGYYYINTTVGTLVTIDSTKPNAAVNDKNEVPPLTKKITVADSIVDESGLQAIAQVGKDVEYTLTVTKKKGAENYEVHDTMGAGLKYKKDLKVTVGGTDVAATNYTKEETDSSLKVKFDNTYMAGLADETVITLVYHVTVTEDALHTDPAKNTAWLEYGHTPGENKTPVVETETYNAKFSVEKKDGKNEPLAGAGFVLKNAAGKYYKFTAGTAAVEADPDNGVEATAATPDVVEWVDSIEDATEYTSGTDGKLNGEFTGLCNGTYTLVEKTVPAGYNAAADYSFTVKDKDVTPANLIQSTTVINNQGAELPSTGGIGTTIFYIIGGLLVIAAGVLLVTRRRMSTEK